MDQVRRLEDPACLDIFVEEMRNLFIGQSHDLYWTQQGECPTEDEYMEMIRQSKPAAGFPSLLQFADFYFQKPVVFFGCWLA